jgi:septum site-determining protein MinC
MPALTMLCLLTDDIETIEQQLVAHLSQMPQFFQHAPVVVDLETLGDSRLDLGRLAEALRRHHLVPVAVRNASERQKQHAVAAGWGLLPTQAAPRGIPPGDGPLDDEPREPSAPPAKSARSIQEPQRAATRAEIEPRGHGPAGLTIRTPVRSGQVVYAMGGDLVVLAPVSSGAELIADGNIHVYAPLRGRALAGAHDNPDAGIFCMSLEAEFLSVDGRYLLADEIPKEQRGRPARAHLRGEDLVITLL